MFIKSHNFYCLLYENYTYHLCFRNKTLRHIKYIGIQDVNYKNDIITVIIDSFIVGHKCYDPLMLSSIIDNVYGGFFLDKTKLDKKDIVKIKLLTS